VAGGAGDEETQPLIEVALHRKMPRLQVVSSIPLIKSLEGTAQAKRESGSDIGDAGRRRCGRQANSQTKKHHAIADVVPLLRWWGGTYATFRPA
jgi:hypothetical protein